MSADFEVRVDVSVRNFSGGGDLRLSETVTLADCSFADMAEILRGFHELAESLKAAKSKAANKNG